MRILVLTSCTGRKAVDAPNRLTVKDFNDPVRLRQREAELAGFCRPAAEMYVGQQHLEVMAGVQSIRERHGREAVDVRIVSAGYGLLEEARLIAPYEVTFQGMGKRRTMERGRLLRLTETVQQGLEGYPLAFVLLGKDYMTAVGAILPALGQRLVSIGAHVPGAVHVPSGRQEASVFRMGTVALKGRLFRLWAEQAANRGELYYRETCGDASGEFVRQVMLGAVQGVRNQVNGGDVACD